VSHPQIAVFARLANGNASPVRAIAGQKSLVARTTHGIAYDDIRDVFMVPQFYGQAILVFKGDANGEVAPIRIIQGPKTTLVNPSVVALDEVNQEIYVPQGNHLLVFPEDANGDVAPIRVLQGAGGNVAIDAVHNLLLAAGGGGGGGGGGSRILIFDRTASGNDKPKGMIGGPHSGLGRMMGPFAIYVPKQEVIIGFRGPGELADDASFAGVWSYESGKWGDTGPLFTFGGPNGLLQQTRGVTIDPVHKEVIVTDKRVNAAITWDIPEIF